MHSYNGLFHHYYYYYYYLVAAFAPDQFHRLVCVPSSSGLLNFCAVALALCDLGYRPVGVRLDSGDLCSLSVDVRQVFRRCSEQ